MSSTRKNRFRTKSRLSQTMGLTVAFLAVGGAALVGIATLRGSSAFSGNHAQCKGNDAYVSGHKVTSVQTNQTFAAIVKFLNDGSTTWSPNYAYFMGQSNGDGTNWQPSGGGLTKDYPPGTEADFLVALKAPSTPGTKNFNWKMGIVYQTMFEAPCTGSLVVVPPPPSAPSLSVSGSSQTTISLAWHATTNTTNYSVFKDGGQVATVTSTAYNSTGLACNTTHSYYVKANGPGGSTQSNTVSKTTSSCPVSGGGGGGGGGSGGGTGGGTGGSTGGTTTPPVTDGSGTDQTGESTDTTQDTGTSDVPSDVSSLSPGQTAKSSPLWQVLLKILLVLVILAGLAFGGLLLVGRYVVSKRQKAVYNDYRKKSQGL